MPPMCSTILLMPNSSVNPQSSACGSSCLQRFFCSEAFLLPTEFSAHGTTNTIVLITSSLTMALSIHAIQINRPKRTITFLILTLILAGVFLGIKYIEYHHKFELGQLPGRFYTFTGIPGSNPHIFFSVYFAMTGLHGLHVIFGMIAISWVLRRTVRNEFSPEYYTPVEMVGLYWHLVDMIWIFLFPLLYLIG
jgi:cytochrome c oxidase subunit 3